MVLDLRFEARDLPQIDSKCGGTPLATSLSMRNVRLYARHHAWVGNSSLTPGPKKEASRPNDSVGLRSFIQISNLSQEEFSNVD